jgi:two-component system sensor histidine kinase KdpD
MTLVAAAGDGVEAVAGTPLSPAELEEARRALATGTNVGARLRDGQLDLMRAYPAQPGPAYVVLPGGVAVLRARRRLRPESRRLAAALLGLAGLLLDRRAVAAVAERARALEASDRLKAAVLSSVSHELKSPIASLRAGLTTLLMPEASLPPEQRDLVAGLDHQATRLDRLVGDLLTMSRLEAGLPPRLSAQDLGEVVGAVLGSLQPALAGLTVRTELEPDLPPVLADEQQVQRVITNLLENAAEWTPAGGAITIGARARGACVEAWVANDGPPIPAADLDRIFEKFWTSRRGGSGLGLAICRLIVEAHGGAIRAENTPRGPRFVFELPLARRPAETAAAP